MNTFVRMQSFQGMFLFKALVNGMIGTGETRHGDMLSRGLRGGFLLREFLGPFICTDLPFTDNELMLTAVALRGKFVDSIKYLKEHGSKTAVRFDEIPDTYIRDFVPLFSSYDRLFKEWKAYDTTPDIAGLVEHLGIGLTNYEEARELEDRDEADHWQKYVISLRKQIAVLFPRVRGGYRMMDPALLADLCMFMPEQTELLFLQ